MFDITISKGYDAGKLSFVKNVENTFEFIGRTRENYGVQGFIEELKNEPNSGDTISISQVGAVHAQIRKNKWYSSQNIFVLTPRCEGLVNLLLIASIDKILVNYGGYSSYPTLKTLNEHIIQLPTKNGKIDFQFMEHFVAELEAQRVAELEAYLAITGLKDYELTDKEKEALETFSEIQWEEHRMGDLFDKVKTNKLIYKAKDLPKEPSKEYVLPSLTSSFMNQGLNYYVPKSGATVLKNVISLPSNSDVYRAYYQSRDFTVLSDSYAIESKDTVAGFTPNAYLFSVSCINKVTDLPIYSYKNKLGGWNVVKNKLIQLPIDSSNKIDFEYMKVFTQAIKKLVIKDVVLYADEKIGATRQVINPKQQFERVNKDGLLSVAEDSKEYY